MKKLITSIGIFLVFQLFSYSQDSLIVEHLKDHVHSFQFENGKLSGEGVTFLKQIAKESPFFLIGEDHGIAEIPQFTAALFKEFKQYGYQYFATETGPVTAKYLQQSAREKDWIISYSAFLEAYPWSIPFYSWKEECGIIDALLEGQNLEDELLWGLDQEFAGGYRLNFQQLEANAENESSRKLAKVYFDKSMMAYDAAFVNKNPQKSFIMMVDASDFEKLRIAFRGQDENLKHIQELEETTHIYRLWFQGEGFQSNYLRAEMMKQHFLNYYNKAKEKNADPKVMFKLGANHVYRGANGLNVFDIGNFISELASQMGTHSFHLYTLARKGTQNAFTPFSRSEADKKKKISADQYLDKVDFSPILDVAPEDQWVIVDLRPLRKTLFSRRIKNVNPGLEKIIWSYDVILLIPEVHASTNFD